MAWADVAFRLNFFNPPAGSTALSLLEQNSLMAILKNLYDYSPTMRTIFDTHLVAAQQTLNIGNDVSAGANEPGGAGSAGGLPNFDLYINLSYWTSATQPFYRGVNESGVTFSFSMHRFLAHELVHNLLKQVDVYSGPPPNSQAVADLMGSASQTNQTGWTVPIENVIMAELAPHVSALDATYAPVTDAGQSRAAYYFQVQEIEAGQSLAPGVSVHRAFADLDENVTTVIDFRNAGNSNDLLFARGGNDTVLSGNGSDFVYGGRDSDALVGGGGADTIYGDYGTLVLDLQGLPSTAAPLGNDHLFGGDSTRVANGQSLTNWTPDVAEATSWLDGVTDRLEGGAGDDTYYVGAGLPTASYNFWDPSSNPYSNHFINPAIFSWVDQVKDSSGNDRIYGYSAEPRNIAGPNWDYMVVESTGTYSARSWVSQYYKNVFVWSTSLRDKAVMYDFALGRWLWVQAFDSNDDISSIPLAELIDFKWGQFGINKGADPTPPPANSPPPPPPPPGTPNNILDTPGDDYIGGTSGDDVIGASTGNDYIDGKEGNDVIAPGSGNDAVVGGAGYDTVSYSASDAAVDVDLDLYATQIGGHAQGDVLESIESVVGSAYDDQVRGTGYNNYLTGGGGSDLLDGRAGDDILDGGLGADQLFGGAGNDTFYVDNAADVVDEAVGAGTDTVRASVSYALGANAENLVLLGTASIATGNALDNALTGNSADNVFTPGLGDDSIAADAGDDLLIVSGNRADYVVSMVDANQVRIVDSRLGGEGTDTLSGVERVQFADGIFTVTALLGSGQSLNGTGNDDVLTGTTGHDVLSGLAGNDLLDGGAGVDIMIGGLGNDTFVIDNASDVVTELAGEGTDTIQSSLSLTITRHVENLTLTGSADLTAIGSDVANALTGNSGANLLVGLAGNDILNGGAGADRMEGGQGDDTYYVDTQADLVLEAAGEGIDTIISTVRVNSTANIENITLIGTAVVNAYANDLNNILIGNSAANTLQGFAGDDYLDGGAGGDQMVGNDGDDTYIVDSTSDSVSELANQGFDQVFSSVSRSIQFAGDIEKLTLTGTSALTATGNALDNELVGNVANNTLDGLSGVDTMRGGVGDDIYVVENTADAVIENAAEGTDLVRSTASSYTLSANVENLTLTGSLAINGVGSGLDNVLTGNTAANILSGAGGNDTIDGGDGNDTLYGGDGADVLTGKAGNDVLFGDAGNDSLNGGTGTDAMTGGSGDDVYIVDNAGDTVTEAIGEGTDRVESSVAWVLGANQENLTLTGSGAIAGTGNALNNWIIGNFANNTLSGADGDDILDGGTGTDTFIGGLGNDEYRVDGPGDIVTELANQGIDTVKSTATLTLAANVENLVLLGTNALSGTGNDLANVITGNSGANTLNGGLGADTLIGGLGNDTYVIENVGDAVTENAGEGTDLVQASISTTLWANVENLTLTGTANINAIGNALNNILTGNTGANLLDGGAGADAMSGGTGNDTYVVDTVGDTATEASTTGGTDLVQSFVSFTLGNNVENLLLTGTASTTGTGNSIANVITGNAGANVLSGLGGNDTIDGAGGDDRIIGGAGSDQLTGGAGSDTFYFATGFGTDVIQVFDDATVDNDVIEFSTSVFATFAAVQAASTQVGADVVITKSTTDKVTLKNTTLSQFGADDFRFVA